MNHSDFVVEELEHHLIEISEILFFLLGAMTIVEIIDQHDKYAKQVLPQKEGCAARILGGVEDE